MKKVFAFAIVAVLLCLVCVLALPTTAEAAVVVDSGTCGNSLAWQLDSNGVLSIYGSGKMWNFSATDEVPWYNNRDDIMKVSLDEGVTSIGDRAFSGCKNVVRIIIPDSVTAIGDYSLQSTGITKVTLPVDLEMIGKNAFGSCANLRSISIPEGVERIEEYTFASCKKLESISLPESIVEIGSGAFMYCRNLKELSIPESVTHIGEQAFWCNDSLEEIVIPDSVIEIGERALGYCNNLTSISIPFVGKSSEESSNLGYLFSTGISSKNTKVVPASLKTVIITGSGKIPAHAFSDCSSITGIVLSDKVLSIGYNAFYNCKGLTKIIVPSNVSIIESGAFSGCDGLKEVSIMGCVTIGADAFKQTGTPKISRVYFGSIINVGVRAMSPDPVVKK